MKLSGFPELSESTSTVTAFYATGLAGPVGSTYKPPNLAFLARRWFESSSRPNAHMHIDLTLGAHLPLSGELRHSARLLFDAAVVRLSDEDTNAIVDEWQHQRENRLSCLVLNNIDLFNDQCHAYNPLPIKNQPWLLSRCSFVDILLQTNTVCFLLGSSHSRWVGTG